MTIHTQPAAIDSVKKSLVALKMPRALEILDTTLRRVEQGEVTWIEALDQLLIEELTLRDNRRVSTALRMSRLTTVKTLAGFDFAFQPSLDRNRILALAELKFIDRAEVVHLLGPPESDSYCPYRYPLRVEVLFGPDRQTMAAGTAAHARRA